MLKMPGQWMAQQQQAGRRLCLILESNDEVSPLMLAVRTLPEYRSLYAETALAELATAGPVLLLLEHLSEPALLELLQRPQTNWGWLGSLPSEDLTSAARHWRERLLVGAQGDQALFRFHDNRTLARVLEYLPTEHWPVFLGPLISVCYWHGDRWQWGENPAPGEYPVPDPAPWLGTPNPNARAILHANILRYLLAEHSEDLAALVEFQEPKTWLAERVSYELPLTEEIDGCPSVLRSVDFRIYAKWGKRYSDVGGDLAAFSIRDTLNADRDSAPGSAIQELHRKCQWWFRTAGPQHAIIKLLACRFSEGGLRSPSPLQRDQLAGKTLRVVLTVSDEEEPAFDDNWVVVPGGWKRCRGKSFEDLDAYCSGNTTEFKPIKMPDGRLCDVYPSCK